jgi:hypothetical protein
LITNIISLTSRSGVEPARVFQFTRLYPTLLTSFDKWGLELSATCVTGLLQRWAERGVEIRLVLDESKPLTASQERIKHVFPVKSGPQEAGRYLEIGGERYRMNLVFAEPVPEPRMNFGSCVRTSDVSGHLGSSPKHLSQRFVSLLPGTESQSIRHKKIFPRQAHSSHLFVQFLNTTWGDASRTGRPPLDFR